MNDIQVGYWLFGFIATIATVGMISILVSIITEPDEGIPVYSKYEKPKHKVPEYDVLILPEEYDENFVIVSPDPTESD